MEVPMDSEAQQIFNNDMDNEMDQKNAFNEQLSGYLNYERQPFDVKLDQTLQLMNIDVCGTIQTSFVKQSVWKQAQKQFKEYDIALKHPLLQIYCITQNGNSVCVNIRDFVPYFFAPFPQQLEQNEETQNLIKQLLNQKMKNCPRAVTKVKIVEAMSLRTYSPDSIMKQKKFMRIQLLSQAYVPELRKIFQEGQHLSNNVFLPRQTYQSNIPYLLRFMIDKQIVGMGWFQVKPGYIRVPDNKKMTRCQLQINASVDLIQALPCEGKWAKIAPLRVLSFDIQCAAQHGFPSAQRDPVIQIACVCKRTDKDIEDYKVVFVLNGATPISGVHIKNMKSEIQMLQDFQKLIITYDPDFIIGYNVVNFDLKYLLQRAQSKQLRLKKYGYFGRNLRKLCKVKSGRFQSKAMGMRETFQIQTDGRIQLDIMIHMHKQHKLSSYRLNNVSYQFLGDQKQDVHHSQITKLHNQSMDGRKRLAIYCLKDAQLPLRLMQKLCCLYNYSQMARVTGVPLNFLLKRGQQIKVVSQLLRKARKRKYIMPTQKGKGNNSEVGFQGAYVLDPKPGFYQQPIATLDFASLYPSIMMAHNLCYTTLIKPLNIQYYQIEKKDITETPQGHYFVKSNIREGLLPEILRQLIGARKKAKKQLAQTTDPMLQKVLDGRQLALKISANSVYGFTGALVGQLPCLQISSSVTAFGRRMIQKTKNIVQQTYKDSEVIYGDTDSVMVKFKIPQHISGRQNILTYVMGLGRQAAGLISKQFISPIKLQFEKVYYPYLLIAKKRYAGVYYTRPDRHDKIDKKGIQSVRRDNCLLIRQVLQTVLETILVQGNKEKAIKYIQQTISNLLQNKIDISKLVITKAISKGAEDQENNKNKKPTYKSKQAHTQLAEKMKKRDENIEINIGDRIPYVIINGVKGSKNYQNAEDPRKVLQEDLPIDYDYYIQKQIKPPLQRLIKNTGIVPNFDVLFAGQHTKIRYAPKISEKSALGAFIKKVNTCLGCKRQSNEVFCENCDDKKVQIYLKKKDQYDQLNLELAKMMKQCGNCQRFQTNQVICQNFDCPIFYRRIKVKKQLQEKQKNIQRVTTQMVW